MRSSAAGSRSRTIARSPATSRGGSASGIRRCASLKTTSHSCGARGSSPAVRKIVSVHIRRTQSVFSGLPQPFSNPTRTGIPAFRAMQYASGFSVGTSAQSYRISRISPAISPPFATWTRSSAAAENTAALIGRSTAPTRQPCLRSAATSGTVVSASPMASRRTISTDGETVAIALMIAKENLVTLDAPDGFRVLSSLGGVSGSATRPHNMLRATFRSIGAFIGLAPIEYLTDAERAREEALEQVRTKASALGADAVIKIRFEAVEQADGSTQVLAHGEAVRLAPKNYAA